MNQSGRRHHSSVNGNEEGGHAPLLHRRVSYGVECMRLNTLMNAVAVPIHRPFEEFDFGTTATNNHFEIADIVTMDSGDDEGRTDVFSDSVCPPGLHGVMERIKARNRDALMLLQGDREHTCIVELLKLLEDAQCPDYMLQKVLQWAYNAKLEGFDFNPRATTRKANVQWMYKALEHSQDRLPHIVPVSLEDHDDVSDVVCFDFAPALLSILQDEVLMSGNNLVINESDPLSMFIPDDGRLGEAHTGSRYRDLYEELAQGHNQLLVPIILYLDGTIIDSKGHIEVCPVSFTTTLLTEKARRDAGAWRLLGYVPDLHRGRSSAMNAVANSQSQKGRTTRNFHRIMDVVLQGLKSAQAGEDRRLKGAPVKLGGKWLAVDIVCPLLFVINDGKQGDQLCGRVTSHHSSTRRHHRSCDCVYEDLSNANVQCSFLTTSEVNNICAHGSEEALQQWSIYRVDNAFNRVQMGSNPHGIFMCAVIDVMHTIQAGVIMYVLESFKNIVSVATLAKIDRMAINFDKTCSQSIRSSFPRSDFSRGITNLTKVECSEQSGALFMMCCFTMQEEGWLALDRQMEHVDAVLGTMECLLCFEAWLDQYHFWEIGDPQGKATEAEDAIAAFMELVKKYLPRESGNGWNVSKFHELKHLVRFIEAFGSPRGYNASRPEEHHKAHAKRPARRARWSMDTIDQQCARRIADTFVIDTIHSMLVGKKGSGAQVCEEGTISTATTATASTSITNVSSPTTREAGGGTSYDIRSFRDPENNMNLRRDVVWRTQTRGDMNLEPNLSMFILQSYDPDLDANGEGSITCCTEYMKFEIASNEKMIHVRSHPNYRSSGKGWYDWAYIRFEDADGESFTDYPSKILSCIPRHRDGVDTFDLVIQCCGVATLRESFLFTEWTFKPDFYVVEASAVVTLCLVIPSTSDGSKVLVARDRSDWASQFCDAANVQYD
jgi:Plavaka transposase